jgi:hypothetical protein
MSDLTTLPVVVAPTIPGTTPGAASVTTPGDATVVPNKPVSKPDPLPVKPVNGLPNGTKDLKNVTGGKGRKLGDGELPVPPESADPPPIQKIYTQLSGMFGNGVSSMSTF